MSDAMATADLISEFERRIVPAGQRPVRSRTSCSFTSATGSPSPARGRRRWSFPTSTEEVVAVVNELAARGVQIVPRGTGTGLAGGCVAFENGVVVSTTRLNRISQDRPGQSRRPCAGGRAKCSAQRSRRPRAPAASIIISRPIPRASGPAPSAATPHQCRRHSYAQGFCLVQSCAGNRDGACRRTGPARRSGCEGCLRIRQLRSARPDLRQRGNLRHHHVAVGAARPQGAGVSHDRRHVFHHRRCLRNGQRCDRRRACSRRRWR